MLIESEGLLFSGPAPNQPEQVWNYPRGTWVPYRYAGPKEPGWGVEISEARAARLRSNNPDAEHYLYYDQSPWAPPPSKVYAAAVTPKWIKRLIALRHTSSNGTR